MTSESVHKGTTLPALAVTLILLSGCASRVPPVAVVAAPPEADAPAAIEAAEGDPVHASIAFHGATRALPPGELARERATLAEGEATPRVLVQQALLLSRPPNGNLARAIALLDAVLASRRPDAAALQPFARLLADQLVERQRLAAASDRLAVQVERSTQQLKEHQRHIERLQEQLEALTEIERTLPGRLDGASSPEQPAQDRRTPP